MSRLYQLLMPQGQKKSIKSQESNLGLLKLLLMKTQFRLLIFAFLIALISAVFRDSLYSTLKRASALPAIFRDIPFSSLKALHIPVKSDNMSVLRAIRKSFVAIEQSEGAGARVRRSIGGMNMRNFSPFLLLDHFSTTSLAGFPDHPHRGQGKCRFFPLSD